ncbi:hypothetical protein [Acidovorax sp. CCYZU-2555]|uniref:hypothetical protein n=1 Tax=Acidovorax sp. CCYZU-2555 TaxID=2835042 RepID=UPI0020BDAE60|nr:hypothetical protein [Acidovorax sp. CCYZU-2555]
MLVDAVDFTVGQGQRHGFGGARTQRLQHFPGTVEMLERIRRENYVEGFGRTRGRREPVVGDKAQCGVAACGLRDGDFGKVDAGHLPGIHIAGEHICAVALGAAPVRKCQGAAARLLEQPCGQIFHAQARKEARLARTFKGFPIGGKPVIPIVV